MKRTISRIKAMINLYDYDLLHENNTLVDEFNELLDELAEETQSESIDYDVAFANDLYNGVIDNLLKIDRTIAICLEKYPLDRVSYIDRALLRIGTYELLFTSTPVPIIINEIVNISKEYSEIDDNASSKFNNSVLDNIAKMVRK